MGLVNYNQYGYVGSSMSENAVFAYEQGEKPKSKWTKAAMLAAIADYCSEYEIELSEEAKVFIEGLKKDDLFKYFFEYKSWHHTNKYANATDFYGLDESTIDDIANDPQETMKDIQHFIAYSNLVNHLRERKQEFRYGELEADTRAHGYLSTGKEIFLNPAIHIDLLLHFTSYLKDKQTQNAKNKDAIQSKPSLSGKKDQSLTASAGLDAHGSSPDRKQETEHE